MRRVLLLNVTFEPLTTVGLRWSGGHRGRRLLLTVAALAFLIGLASFWTAQGQFRGW